MFLVWPGKDLVITSFPLISLRQPSGIRNIQNVIAKMESGRGGAKDALLVNCHFDSVPQSPGASDDAVSCAIMLEILDVLMQSDRPFRHNLIFLFNGAEENLLPVG